MTKRVRIKIIPPKLPSFTSTTVFQQLTGCKFEVPVTVSINFDVFLPSLPGGELVS